MFWLELQQGSVWLNRRVDSIRKKLHHIHRFPAQIHQSIKALGFFRYFYLFHFHVLISIDDEKMFCVCSLRRQINSKTYCGKGYVGGKCKVRCEGMQAKCINTLHSRDSTRFLPCIISDLLSDDITKSAQCAQIVLNTEGFKAWRGWEQKCKKSIPELPPLKECWRAAAIAG